MRHWKTHAGWWHAGLMLYQQSYIPTLYQLSYVPTLYQLSYIPTLYQQNYIPTLYQLSYIPTLYQLSYILIHIDLHWSCPAEFEEHSSVTQKLPLHKVNYCEGL